MKPLQNLAFVSILFLLMSSGCSTSKDNVTVYNHTALGLSCNITFTNDCPTYGLPLAEYAILVELLGKGDVEEAKRRLNMFLDLAVDDAMSRRVAANEEQRKAIDKTLLIVAEMRNKYPRNNSDERKEFKQISLHVDKELEKILETSKLHEDYPKIKVEEIEGAIIPANTIPEGYDNWALHHLGIEAQGIWTPGVEDIKAAESRLRNALEKKQAEPFAPDEDHSAESIQDYKNNIGLILKNYSKYSRQYIGLIIDGKKYIYLNSFPNDGEHKYTKAMIGVKDGGFWYWRTLFSVEEKTFEYFSINGEA